MNYFIMGGLFLDFIGAIILFWLAFNPKFMDDKKDPIFKSVKTDSNGVINFIKLRWSGLEKKSIFALLLICIGFLLQLIGAFS